jgi:hypothetical protein
MKALVRRQIVVSVEPQLVKGGDESYVLRRSFDLEVPGQIWAIGSFLGLDTGDIVEAHAEVVQLATGRRLYARSLHKEAAGIYDAWDWRRMWAGPDDLRDPVQAVRVSMLCRVTGRNWLVFTRRWSGPLTAYFHGEAVIEHSLELEIP